MTELALIGYRPAGRLDLVRAYLSATAGIVRRDAVIRASYRGTLISTLVMLLPKNPKTPCNQTIMKE